MGRMDDRTREVTLLREIAERLREIARTHPTEMSDKLTQVAAEFDAHADEIDRRRRRH
jgi:phage host-nuclease inhibitor protein Gam